MVNFEIIGRLEEIVFQTDTVVKCLFVDRYEDGYVISITKSNFHLLNLLSEGAEYVINATLKAYRKASGVYNSIYINGMIPIDENEKAKSTNEQNVEEIKETLNEKEEKKNTERLVD